VQMVADTLSEVWDLEVLCPCVHAGVPWCDGACLANTVRALGICMTVGGGVGLSSAHPSAIKPGWSLHYGKPLTTPGRASQEYLSCIFTSSLTAALPWQHSWSAQILSALAWAQVALARDYGRMTVMRALHKSMRRVYSASPWNAENTMRAVYAVAHHQLCAQHVVVTRVMHWLFRNAHWQGTQYTNTVIPAELQPDGCTPVWTAELHLLRTWSAAA
jgi:hypothetical protein